MINGRNVRVSNYICLKVFEMGSVKIINELLDSQVFISSYEIQELIQALQQVQKMKESGEWRK